VQDAKIQPPTHTLNPNPIILVQKYHRFFCVKCAYILPFLGPGGFDLRVTPQMTLLDVWCWCNSWQFHVAARVSHKGREIMNNNWLRAFSMLAQSSYRLSFVAAQHGKGLHLGLGV
jgi:RNase P subunit RPR2